MADDPILKRIFTVTVLSRESDAGELNGGINDPFDLHELADAIFDGAWIGQVEAGDWLPVAAEQVQAELLAIGNDGDFFGTDEDDDGEL